LDQLIFTEENAHCTLRGSSNLIMHRATKVSKRMVRYVSTSPPMLGGMTAFWEKFLQRTAANVTLLGLGYYVITRELNQHNQDSEARDTRRETRERETEKREMRRSQRELEREERQLERAMCERETQQFERNKQARERSRELREVNQDLRDKLSEQREAKRHDKEKSSAAIHLSTGMPPGDAQPPLVPLGMTYGDRQSTRMDLEHDPKRLQTLEEEYYSLIKGPTKRGALVDYSQPDLREPALQYHIPKLPGRTKTEG